MNNNMDWIKVKAEIRAFGAEIGIDKIGFTDALPLTEHLPLLLSRQNAGYRFAINEGDPQKRISPMLHLLQAKSIISVAVAYSGHNGEKPKTAEPVRGRISVISQGVDYHKVVRAKLTKLREFILANVPDAQLEMFVDTGEILEKAIAVKAGLGWFGRNTLLITPEFGSWVSLGELVTNLPLPADEPCPDSCGPCRRCVTACPTRAIDEEKNINLDRCLACLTLSKALPPVEVREQMGDSLYGCDICQAICPINQKNGAAKQIQGSIAVDEAYPILLDILQMCNAEFKKRFGHTSGVWRGRTPMQRNAVITAGNLQDFSAIPALKAILAADPRPVLRAAAAWALGKLGTEQCQDALLKALAVEQDNEVLTEINLALHKKKKGPQNYGTPSLS